MAKVYISEYARTALGTRGAVPTGEEPSIATQVLDTTSGHQESTVFNAETRFVRIHTDGIISYIFGATPVATTSHARMAANQTEYFGVPQAAAGGANEGLKVSVVTNT